MQKAFVLLIIVAASFVCVESSNAIYSCFNNETGKVLYTNLVCPQEYSFTSGKITKSRNQQTPKHISPLSSLQRNRYEKLYYGCIPKCRFNDGSYDPSCVGGCRGKASLIFNSFAWEVYREQLP